VQNNLSNWDFFTADEIIEYSEKYGSVSLFRTFCQKHGLSLLFEDEYISDGFRNKDYLNTHEFFAGKGCELTWSNRNGNKRRSLKPTSCNAFGIILTIDDLNDRMGTLQWWNPPHFAFPTQEARNTVIKELRSKGYLLEGSKSTSSLDRYACYEENGLYWLNLTVYDNR
jgi:hypothetical protein